MKRKSGVLNVILSPDCITQLEDWINTNPRTASKILSLIKDITRDPFSGPGKPEPLKHQLKGKWSRRINQEDRLVYEITNDSVIVLSCIIIDKNE